VDIVFSWLDRALLFRETRIKTGGVDRKEERYRTDWLFEAEVRHPSLKIPEEDDWVGINWFFSFSVSGLTRTRATTNTHR
jgi:hypothetical protein